MATDKKNQEGGAAGMLIMILAVAVAVYAVFRCSKLVFTYSRSVLLAVWTFSVLIFLIVFTFMVYEFNDITSLLLGLWGAGVGSILFSTYSLYKIKKPEVDKLIKKETSIDQQVSKGRSSAVRLFTGAGALYAGYKIGHKTGL